jgi:hypothetical protein
MAGAHNLLSFIGWIINCKLCTRVYILKETMYLECSKIYYEYLALVFTQNIGHAILGLLRPASGSVMIYDMSTLPLEPYAIPKRLTKSSCLGLGKAFVNKSAKLFSVAQY